MLDEQLRIKGGGVVIIYLGPFFQSLAVLTLIVIVMADDGDFRAEMLFQMPGEGGFAGADTAGDTDQDGTHEEPPISYKVAGTWVAIGNGRCICPYQSMIDKFVIGVR